MIVSRVGYRQSRNTIVLVVFFHIVLFGLIIVCTLGSRDDHVEKMSVLRFELEDFGRCN